MRVGRGILVTKIQEGQVWVTKPNPTGKLVGYEVTGVGLEFVSISPLGHPDSTRYFTKDELYGMFDLVGGEDN
jgi:hypothetical protein